MGRIYRLGFERALPGEQNGRNDARWSLDGLDPTTPIRTGHFIASDQEAVPYRLWPAAAPRALILLLHGAFDYSGAFDEIGPWFAQRGFTAMAIDQRGFGATASRGQWRGKTRMIRDVIEAVSFLRGRFGAEVPVFVLGESMGAALAVHAAARAPDLDVAGLVLAAPCTVSGVWRTFIWASIIRILRLVLPNSGMTVERVTAGELTPAAAIRLLADPLVLRRVRLSTLFGLLKLARRAVDEAERVRVPVLTMAGSSDVVLRVAWVARLYAKLSGAKEWACFADGPHLLLHWKDRDRPLARGFAWIGARLMERGHSSTTETLSGADSSTVNG
jgi:alpha-beta hydrolase superfamily lysophospholipase